MEPERDLRGPAEEIDGGDASDDSFVIVSDIISGNGSSEEHDLAPDHPDLVIRDRNAEDGVLIERSVETVTDHAVLEAGVVGVATSEASGSGFDGEELNSENAGAGGDVEGSALAVAVEELNSETMAVEKEQEEGVDVGEEVKSEAKVAGADQKAEVESSVKVEEHQLPEAVVTEVAAADVDVVDEGSNEIGSAVNVEEAGGGSEAVGPEVDVDVGEEINSVAQVTELDQEAVAQLSEAPIKETKHDELVADVDVEEELNSLNKVAEADQQAEHELAIKPQEQHQLPETSGEEIGVQDLAADVDVGEELSSVGKVVEADQQAECELAFEPEELEQQQLPETSVKEINVEDFVANVDVGEELNSMTKVPEADQQAECESAVEREEQEQHQLPETSVTEIGPQELAVDVDVGGDLNSITKVTEADQLAKCELEQHQLPETSVKEIRLQELAANVDVGEDLNSMTKVAEANQQAECELAVEREERVQHQLPETSVKEVGLQELAADVDVGEELNSVTKVVEADQQAKCELAVEREEQEQHQLSETSAKEMSLQELAADVDVGEELHTMTKVSEVDQQAEFETRVELEVQEKLLEVAIKGIELQKLVTDIDVGEELNSETKVPEAKQLAEVATLDEQHQLPENAVTEAKLEEVAEAVNVAEGSNSEAKGADVDQQSLESAVKLEEDQLPQDAVTKAQLQELAAVVNVLEKLDFEIKVAEADQAAAIESSVQAAENHEAESMVTKANAQKESELVEDKDDPEIVAESISQAEPEAVVEEPESALEVEEKQEYTHVEEKQNADTVASFTGQEMEPKASAEAEVFVTGTDSLAEPEFSLQEEHQPWTEVVETDVHGKSQSLMLGEKQQEADTAITNTEPDERAEPECADLEETEEPRKIEASMIADQAEETQEPETLTGESSVLDTKPQSINDFPENGTGDATISALKSSATPMLSQVLDKEIVIEAVTNVASKHGGDVCETTDDSEMELEHSVHETECMASHIEGDQSMHNDDGEKSILEEVEGFDSMQAPLEEPALDGPGKNAVKKQHFCYLIRIPRPTDDNLRTKLQQSRLQLDEKTKIRDSVRVELQKKKATINDYQEKLEAARVELRAARAAVAAKRQEMELVQSMIDKMRQASSIDEINEKIHYMDQTLQHESISLTQEKKYIREIKNLKQLREQISANMGTQAEIQEALDRRDEIEDEYKTLKKEMDSLRTTVLHADSDFKAALKRCDDEKQLRKNLQEQYTLVDNDRQAAYSHMHNLRIESNDKIKNFNQYKDDQRTAMNYVNAGDKEGIRTHCNNQVEIVMELWNRDDEFRKQYVKSNEYSTLRRLRTLDGRSLGPDEEPPVLPTFDHRTPSKLPSNLPNDNMHFPPLAVEAKKEVSVAGTVPEQKVETNNSQKQKSPATCTGAVKVMATVSNTELVEKASEKETTSSRTKEEEDLARKAEELARKEDELRKERAAAELKEQHRMEQKAKAKEAEERKKKKAEKDKAKAEHRAKKEAELKEKRRAKKEKKTMPTNATSGAGGDDALIVDATPLETAREPETVVGAAPRRSSRPSAILKQQHNKIQPLPLPLRKGKRKMQTWMWVLVSALLVVVLFLAGNYVPFSSLSMASFGFKG